ncbi:MAG: hypothetical protein KBE09_03435 [Candidatus Pacebacteria bacterium]|nr:hypothetical protein [Candidatus Paceibacterota bacterium]
MQLIASNDAGNAEATLDATPFDWETATKRLRTQLSRDVYEAWFLSLKFETYDRASGIVTVSVATPFLRRWLTAHHEDVLVRSAIDAGNSTHPVRDVRIQSREEVRQFATPKKHQPVATPKAMGTRVGQTLTPQAVSAPRHTMSFGLHPDFTFATFRLTEQHRLAYTVVQYLLAQRNCNERPLPAYLHGMSGAGKTHLLHAFARQCMQQGRVVQFWSAATADACSITAPENDGDRVLVIDNIDYGNHHHTELESILERAWAHNDQVIITGSLPIGDLRRVPERVRNRLTAGLVAPIAPFDDATKQAVLASLSDRMRLRNERFVVPPSVFESAAAHLPPHGHALEGFVMRLFAHHMASGTLPNKDELAALVAALTAERTFVRVQITDVQRCVCHHFCISKQDLISQRRHRMVTLPRQVAMYLCKQLTGNSMPEIGRRFGNRDHTTVLHAVRKIEKVRKEDTSFSELVDELKRRIRPDHEE